MEIWFISSLLVPKKRKVFWSFQTKGVNFKYSKYSENDTFVYGFLIHNQDSDNEYEAFIRENFIILN